MNPSSSHLRELIASIKTAMREALNAGRLKGADELRAELAWLGQAVRVAER